MTSIMYSSGPFIMLYNCDYLFESHNSIVLQKYVRIFMASDRRSSSLTDFLLFAEECGRKGKTHCF